MSEQGEAISLPLPREITSCTSKQIQTRLILLRKACRRLDPAPGIDPATGFGQVVL